MKNILIIDDSNTSRMLFKLHMPTDPSLVFYESKDLSGALEIANKQHPELVVLDYNMPGNNGIEIAQQLQKIIPNATFVLLTANVQQAILDEARAIGITSVFEKPISKALIDQLVHEAL